MNQWSRRQVALGLAAAWPAFGHAAIGRAAPGPDGQRASGDSAQAAIVDALRRAQRHADLNAFVSLRGADALHEAAAVDRRIRMGAKVGLLAGKPLAIKDNIDVAGVATTACTPALRGNVAKTDAPAVARLRAAGGLILGKAGLHELAFGSTCVNPVYGTIHNPVDPSLIPGGSSGGVAAAIGAGIVTSGLGTDTAGSVRMPASLCGIVGFRPSIGRYPQGGVVPLSHSRDVIGPMGRTLEDVRLLDAVLADEQPQPVPDLRADAITLVMAEDPLWLDLHPHTEAIAREAIDRLTRAGVRIRRVSMPSLLAAAAGAGTPILLGEMIPDMRTYLASRATPVALETLIDRIALPDVKAAWAQTLASEQLMAYLRHQANDEYRPAVRRALLSLLGDADALVFPTTPAPALAVGAPGRWTAETTPYTRNMDPAAVTGWCGVSLPVTGPGKGLPVGLSIEAPGGQDRKLLAIAALFEKIFSSS